MAIVRISKEQMKYLRFLSKKTGHSLKWHADNALDDYVMYWEDMISSKKMERLMQEYQRKRQEWQKNPKAS